MIEARFHGGEFGRSQPFLEIVEMGLGGCELLGGLSPSGEFGGVFEGEKRVTGADASALGDREVLKLAGERSGHIDKVAFEVVLIRRLAVTAAAIKREARK